MATQDDAAKKQTAKKTPDAKRSAAMRKAWRRRHAARKGGLVSGQRRRQAAADRAGLGAEMAVAQAILKLLRPLPPASQRVILDFVADG